MRISAHTIIASLATGTVLLGVVTTIDAAAARHRHHRAPAVGTMAPYPTDQYYQLPFRGYLEPGTAEILRPRCNDSYPMTESMPCDTATGGPVGGRGS